MERWRRFKESGDGAALRKRRAGTFGFDYQAAMIISEDFLLNFGQSKEMEVVLELKRQIAKKQIERILKGERRIENEVQALKIELENELKKSENGIGIMEMKALLDKEFGFFKLSEITVLDFYTKIKLLEKIKENGRAD